jgi:hypothetical protein
MKEYPEDYTGPKSGQSNDSEWIAVRDYDAFRYVKDGTWTYSDFDCYLYAMCGDHYAKGRDATVQALKAFQERHNIKAEYNKC